MALTTTGWIIVGLVALLTGFSKTGLTGIGILSVVLLTTVIPARASVGVMLPMLIVGDVFAVLFYRRHASWKHLWRLYPWVAVGLVFGFVALATIRVDAVFSRLLGGMALVVLALQAVRSVKGGAFLDWVPQQWWFAAVMGVLGGFFTAVSNAAGPIFTAYVLAMGFDKRVFMGTSAWYFLTVNVVKAPPMAGLGLITRETLLVNAAVAPLIILSALLGPLFIKVVPQKAFEWSVFVLAAAGAAKLLIGV